MPARQDGGALRGGAPRVVWFSSESDPRVVSARSVAADLLREGTPAHLVWNPCSGEIIQQLPVTRAARLLDDPVGHEGRVCVQVMVVSQARDPFTGTLLKGLHPIVQWLDGWRISRRWPAGPPLPSPQSYHSGRDRRHWARGGHFGASQVPGLHRPDPGGIDIRRITGPDTPVTAVPRQGPIPGQGVPRHVPPDALPPATREPRAPISLVPPAPAPAGPAPEQPAAARKPVPLPRIVDPVSADGPAHSPPEDGPAPRRPSAPLSSTPPPPDAPPAPVPARNPAPPRPVPEPASMRS
ncbi:hypothetical protein ACFY4C_16745 [Actinomadura viridis]|uniref:hypothetical protein n=1 Tax=Actinomadura viridis TaxID=58110 RepID=UPI0036A71911